MSHMQTIRTLSRHLYGISPLLPFYLLGLTPGQVLWPVIFIPVILGVNFVWALVLATATVVMLGETERVGQRILVRYAVWATISGLIINIGHDITLSWLSQRVDFLLEAQPWRLIGGTFLVPCVLLFAYHWLLAWQYLRLRVWQALIMGILFAVLTAPWTTLTAVDFGQGRFPTSAQKLLWLGVVLVAAAPAALGLGTAVLRRSRRARRVAGTIAVAGLAVLVAAGGGSIWTSAISTPAIGTVGVSGIVGDLAFATRGRVYAVRSSAAQVRSLGHLRGQVVAWSPNGRLLLVNEQRADGKIVVSVMSADETGTGLAVGTGQAASGPGRPIRRRSSTRRQRSRLGRYTVCGLMAVGSASWARDAAPRGRQMGGVSCTLLAPVGAGRYR